MSTCSDLRAYILPLYVPAFAATVAQALVLSTLPIYLASTLSADAATVGAVVGMQGIGSPLSAFPAGVFADKCGTRFTMLLGSSIRFVAYVACSVVAVAVVGDGLDAAADLLRAEGESASGSYYGGNSSGEAADMPVADHGWAVGWLAMARFLTGIGLGTFQVARSGWVKETVPNALRGRANSGIGGCARLANVIGPALGGVIMASAGGHVVFIVQAIFGVAAHHRRGGGHNGSSSGRMIPEWVKALWPAAPIGFSFVLTRAVRQLLIPLKADALHLGVSGAGYVTAASFAFDAAAFPAAGYVMDRYGRRAAGVPSLGLMAFGLCLLGMASSTGPLIFASAVLGVGNGLSSGLVMTIGQDAAPSQSKGKFIGAFKVCTDSALFLGPLSVGLITSWFSLDAACWVMGIVAGFCAAYYGLSRKVVVAEQQQGGGAGTSSSSPAAGTETMAAAAEGAAAAAGGGGQPPRRVTRKHQRLFDDDDDI